MLEIFKSIFDAGSFIPHGHCYLWQPWLVWLHILSDSLIALAYYCIPLLLIYIVRKRGDIPFDGVFLLFGSFIIACGTGHISNVWTLWYPTYWLSGLIKAFTAIISVGTAVVLVALIPKILTLPSPAQLEAANQALEKEILERKQVEAQLRTLHQQLTFHIENSPLAVIEWNDEYRVQRWSEQAEKVFGWTAEEVLNRHPKDWLFVFVEDIQSVNDAIKDLTNRSQGRNIIHNRNYTKNGSFVHCEWYNSALFDEFGNLVSVLSLVLDVTERIMAEEALQAKTRQLEEALQELKCAQTHLIQSEKMSSLGQLVAGVAHEINNPVNFIYGNLVHASEYTQNLIHILHLYKQYYPEPIVEIQAEIEDTDLDFLVQDLPKMLSSMKLGADRIRQIVLSLRNFSRLDEAEVKAVNIHEGLDSTLLILQNRLKEKIGHRPIQVIKEYGNLPLVECYAGQMNQVFMNILINAIDALEEYHKKHSGEVSKQLPSTIRISTEVQGQNQVIIRIADNGSGMSEETCCRLFDPFFTTKPVGVGTGLGLSISYQIVVDKHGGQLRCYSAPGQGTEFLIEIPVCQLSQKSA